MSKVIPIYEVLYTDLRNHYIGRFLASREFKIFMSKQGYFEQWTDIYESVKYNRSYFAFGTDHEPSDASDTLAVYLNEIPDNRENEKIVSEIIAQFVEHTKEKSDFSDVLQSMEIAKFSVKNIRLVSTAIEKHKAKKFPENENMVGKQKSITVKNIMSNIDVFVVHGHNEEMKHNVARVLEKLKLHPIILNEQSNEGLTIIEKLEKYSNVSFAIILLTFDDYGYSKTVETKNKRARQNVVLELGYFLARLGRKNVLPLYEDGVELPSDFSGVLYTKIDDSENWKFRMVKELQTVGFQVDANAIL